MLREKISGADAGVDAMGARLGALDAVAAADGEGASTSGGGAFATVMGVPRVPDEQT